MEKKEVVLPELSKEQVEALITHIRKNIDTDSINYDNLCCADDGVSAGIRVTIEALEKCYGLFVPEEEEEEEDE